MCVCGRDVDVLSPGRVFPKVAADDARVRARLPGRVGPRRRGGRAHGQARHAPGHEEGRGGAGLAGGGGGQGVDDVGREGDEEEA